MKVITEHTCGTHIYMCIGFDDGTTEEIDVYLHEDGPNYKTTADNDAQRRAQIIDAFNKLY